MPKGFTEKEKVQIQHDLKTKGKELFIAKGFKKKQVCLS